MKNKLGFFLTQKYIDTKKSGFTLVEVMVVMAIIAVLAVLIIGAITIARQTAVNTKKTSEIKDIMTALEAYKTRYRSYPAAVGIAACGGWEVGNVNSGSGFLTALNALGMNPVPTDPDNVPAGSCDGYKYYRYNAGSYACPGGRYYVLGITRLNGRVSHPTGAGPGWSCPNRNWGSEFDWVTGGYE